MLKRLFEESDHPSEEVLEEIARIVFEDFCEQFDINPSPGLCAEFIKAVPKIAAHESLISPLVQKILDWRDVYLGFGMISEWDRLVKSVSAKVLQYLGYEEGWDTLGRLHLSRVLVTSLNGNYNGIETAFEIAMDFGDPERDLFVNIERMSALVNSHSYARLLPLYDEARQYFAEAREKDESYLQLRALVMMSRFESKLGNHTKAFELAQQGILLAQAHDKVALAVTLLAIIILPYLETNTRPQYLRDVFGYWDRNIDDDNHFGRALYNGNYGVFLLKQGDYAGAKRHLTQARAFYGVAGWDLNLGRILLSLGAACGYMGDFDTAEEVFCEALDIYTELDILDHVVMAYNNLGWIYEEIGHNGKAIDFYESALEKAGSLPASEWKTSLTKKIKGKLRELQ